MLFSHSVKLLKRKEEINLYFSVELKINLYFTQYLGLNLARQHEFNLSGIDSPNIYKIK